MAYRGIGSTAPIFKVVEITPSDSTVLEGTRALWIGTGGNVRVTTADGQTVTFANVFSGTLLPVQVTAVFATSTTASSILGLY